LQDASYTLIDESETAIEALPAALEGWAGEEAERKVATSSPNQLSIEHKGGKVDLTLVRAELSEFLESSELEFDLVIANAVLDLVDLERVLPILWARSAPAAFYWFTVNFDGESVFLPAMPDDGKIFEAYHGSMAGRYSGRALFSALRDSGAEILLSGSSDWVVHSTDQGYRDDEAYFLHHIVHTVDQELREHPNLNPGAFAEWIKARHEQVDRGELVYIAHQLDFVGLSPDGSKAEAEP
jgi:hypothetical protein